MKQLKKADKSMRFENRKSDKKKDLKARIYGLTMSNMLMRTFADADFERMQQMRKGIEERDERIKMLEAALEETQRMREGEL